MSTQIEEDILDITENLKIFGTGGTYAVSFPAPTTLTSNITFPIPTTNPSIGNIFSSSSSTIGNWSSGGFQSGIEVYVMSDAKSSGTEGGTFTYNAWRTRVLNTLIKYPSGASHISLSSNQITIQSGTYSIYAKLPAVDTNSNKSRLQNITDNTTTIIGTPAYNQASNITTSSFIEGTFTIASTKVFEIQHRTAQTTNVYGFGRAVGFGENEIYALVSIIKLS